MIKKVVLTGGPCSGKTMALNQVKKYFEKCGKLVVLVEEVPTELMKMGITLDRFGKIPFQKAIIDLQQKKEQVTIDAINSLEKSEEIIILYDRGILDHYVYINSEQKQLIEKELGISDKQLYRNYDMIMHMISTATEMPNLYVKTEYRHENVEEAKEIDYKIEKIWSCHPKYIKISCEIDFGKKVQKLLEKIEEN